MAFLFAGLASLSFGVGDFFGGLASRKAPVMSIVLFSQLIGGAGILIAAPMTGAIPGRADFGYGAAAGLVGAVGLILLYHGLSRLSVSVVALVTGLVGTGTPVVFGVVTGERPGAIAWLGIGLAIVAITLVSSAVQDVDGKRSGSSRAVLVGAAAGLLFGFFSIFISRTSTESGLWPLIGARVASVAVVLIAVLILRRPRVPAAGRAQASVAGALDMSANVFLLLSVRLELLSLVTVIMALAPAWTIAMARIVSKETITPPQAVGMLIGVVGVTMIVLG